VYTVKVPVVHGDFAVAKEEEAAPRHAFEGIENLDMEILIVDDEEYVRNTIYYLFDKKGCRVTLAEDGEFGLSMAKEKPFDLVFMDYLMPKMGGMEAARKIHEHNRDVKIVFITGRDSLDENELYKAGVYACIRKPFEMRELYDIARKVAMEKGLID
jgi:DNA-binding response OmpR family regulator